MMVTKHELLFATAQEKKENRDVQARNLEITLRSLKLKAEKPEDYWHILGGNAIGSKAEEMQRKTGAAIAAGFDMIPRIVLAMGFFEDFRKRTCADAMTGAPATVLQDRINNTPFNDREMREIFKLVKRLRAQFGSVPIAVRSSAFGDARGTGTYESTMYFNYRKEAKALVQLVKAIKTVLASEFSANAIAFREKTGLGPGMAVVIEPVFGTFGMGMPDYWTSDRLLFGPDFGGIGYSSTAAGGPRVYFNPGLPTLAVAGKGFLIEEIDGFGFNEYLDDEDRVRQAAGPLWNCHPTRNKFEEWQIGQVIEVPGGRLLYAYKVGEDATAEPVYAALRKLDKELGPQYVEWALAHMENELRLALIQIADMNISTDWFDFKETGHVLLRSNFVVHSGTRDCDSIVEVRDFDDIYRLSRYNQDHEGYIVVYNGVLGSAQRQKLPFSAISNAAVVVEHICDNHAMHPIAHWETQLAESGKIFFVVDWYGKDRSFFASTQDNRNGLIVHNGKFRVTASERQGRAIVERLD